METEQSRSIDFTNEAWESLYDTVDDKLFGEEDPKLIYKTLRHKMRLISFGDYLKRYICIKAELTGSYKSHSDDLYRKIIRDAFFENGTPPSFSPTTAKLSALTKNWLNQQSVNRNVVFLLGFGLAMSVEDVNDFLTKSLREREINPKMPFEVICWYCYKYGFKYPKFQQLMKSYERLPVALQETTSKHIEAEGTIGIRRHMQAITDDRSLLSYLATLKTPKGGSYMSMTARKYFLEMYDEVKELIAKYYNETPDKEEQLFSKDEISGGDIEKVILSAVPIDSYGNLTSAKKSALNQQFSGKRFSRQRISELLNGGTEITRFDLITLSFFIFSQLKGKFKNAQDRYAKFVEYINKVLLECCMGGLYVANPYECFVLMCLLSDDPLTTYADVWALSYKSEQTEVRM